MDNEVRPTWRLAWGLWWRMLLISLGIGVIISLISLLVGMSLVSWLFPWEARFEWEPGRRGGLLLLKRRGCSGWSAGIGYGKQACCGGGD